MIITNLNATITTIFALMALTIVFSLLDVNTTYSQTIDKTDWVTNETEKLTFQYPKGWLLNISDSRFDNYDFYLFDPTTNASIQVSDEATTTTFKFLYENDPKKYLENYLVLTSPPPSSARLIEKYPTGKVTIVGNPASSQLYLNQDRAVLISLAFQKDNDRHYIIYSSSPSSNFDKLEPTMLEIIKSITLKQQQ